MTTISDYQIVIATTGLVLGPGTDYIIKTPSPLGLQQVRTNPRPRPFDHGEFLSPEFIGAKTHGLSISVRGDDPADTQANVDALLLAWYYDATGPDEFDTGSYLVSKLPGQAARRLYGRPRQSSADLSTLVHSHSEAEVVWYAGDPRWYSDLLHTSTLNAPVTVSGKGFNKQFDYGWGGSGSAGSAEIINEGSLATWPVITLTGPLTNIVLTNETTGKTLTITYTLALGETLVIDFNAKTVLLNGTASRYSAKSGLWWQLVPGSNTIRMTANSGAGSGSISWRDAWS